MNNPKCYILNYYTWSNDLRKRIGQDSPIGYYTKLEFAIKALKEEIALHKDQELVKNEYWWYLEDKRNNWRHYYEVFEIQMNVESWKESISDRVRLIEEELA